MVSNFGLGDSLIDALRQMAQIPGVNAPAVSDDEVLKLAYLRHFRFYMETGDALVPEDLARKLDLSFKWPFGGATVCVLRNTQSETTHIGVSVCSFQDRFSEGEGAALARERAELAAFRDVRVVLPTTHGALAEQAIRQIDFGYLVGDHLYDTV